MSVTVIAIPAREVGCAGRRGAVVGFCVAGAAAGGFCVVGAAAGGFCVVGAVAGGFCVAGAGGFCVVGACAKASVPVSIKLGRSNRFIAELSPMAAYNRLSRQGYLRAGSW
jgi:hypothetical protein